MPSWESLLSYVAASSAFLLGVIVFWRERGKLAYTAFALGMAALAVRELLGVQALSSFESEARRWHRYRFAAEAVIPGLWLLFALTFARVDPGRFVRRWRWPLAVAFLLPGGIVVFGWESLVRIPSLPVPSWLVLVGPAGLWLHGALLLASMLVLMNLENTFQSAVGSVRWQIKFTVLGIGILFGVQIFAYSQVLLYSMLQTSVISFNSFVLLITCAFVVTSLVWRRLGSFDIYVSPEIIIGWLTLLVVGLYLLVVSGLVELIKVVVGQQRAPAISFVVLLAVVGLVLLLLSTEFQQRIREFVNRHLKRPTHDYRRLWHEFTRRTSPLMEIGPLATSICNLASETFGCSSATIWLVKEGERKLVLGGSSALSAEEGTTILKQYAEGRDWLEIMETKLGEPIDLRGPSLPAGAPNLVRVVQASYSVALLGGEEKPIGFLTVNDRVTGKRYSFEDFALLKTFADQSSAAIRNRQLTNQLARAKEMETFQTLSTFFVHDLKNLANRFALAQQNIPLHFDKPAFREDLVRTMEKSVAKIENMTRRLSSLSRGSSANRVECDLNALVREALAGLTGPAGINGSVRASVDFEGRELPPVAADPEEIQNVVTNLVLNAYEATGPGGSIKVRTSRENGWVLVSVTDDGPGMSREFLANNLFKPFQTTKKNGLGIGLYQSKTVVEAHGGRIEVESALGTGTTFRVFLPSGAKSRA